MKGNVIEISGLPCSGKSYFCNDINGFLNKKHNSLIKVLIFEIEFFMLGLSLLKASELYKFFLLCLREKAPIRYRIKIFRNIIKKFGVFKKFKNVSSFGYVDEGISHIPFNFLSGNTVEIINILKPYIELTNVKYIKIDNDLCLRKRLIDRGHARLSFFEIDDFIFLNRKVETVLMSLYPNICLTFEVIENA